MGVEGRLTYVIKDEDSLPVLMTARRERYRDELLGGA